MYAHYMMQEARGWLNLYQMDSDIVQEMEVTSNYRKEEGVQTKKTGQKKKTHEAGTVQKKLSLSCTESHIFRELH